MRHLAVLALAVLGGLITWQYWHLDGATAFLAGALAWFVINALLPLGDMLRPRRRSRR